MENEIIKSAYIRLRRAMALKYLIFVIICGTLTATGLPGLHTGTGWTAIGGPQSAFGQALVEPFEGSGPIEEVGENGKILIGDRIFKLSDVVRFYRNFTKQEEISPTWFAVGKKVGFIVNQFNEIDEMWLE